MTYDAVLVLSYGGPEGPADVMPFLENVVRGKRVSPERLEAVAKHYDLFGGVSPINSEVRELVRALCAELNSCGIELPVYLGNRHWYPMIPETVRQMADDGIRRALVFTSSAYNSYHGCRQYREALDEARQEMARQEADAPEFDKLRAFFNHPGFIEPMVEQVLEAIEKLPEPRRNSASLVYTAHSIPTAMAANSAYVEQLTEATRLVSERLGRGGRLAYQSRSGPPSQPWLGPDLGDVLRQLASDEPGADVILCPIGFLCDHMEIIYDLDIEARDLCVELGLNMVRVNTLGSHPRFVQMIRELIVERLDESPNRLVLGDMGPSHDVCPDGCCLPK